MYVSAKQLVEIGVNKKLLEDKVSKGEWLTREPLQSLNDEVDLEILLSSLPQKLQLKWAQNNPLPEYPERIAILLSEATEHGLKKNDDEITKLLTPLSPAERRAWMEEALRMAKILERYARIKPKRRRDSSTGAYEFVEGVIELCWETECKDHLVLARQPHKAARLAPHTIDDLYRKYRKHGLLVFLPKIKKELTKEYDERRSFISREAMIWVNKNWRIFSGARPLFEELKEEAEKHGWTIPSESWFYRRWEEIPAIVKTVHQEGKNSYIS